MPQHAGLETATATAIYWGCIIIRIESSFIEARKEFEQNFLIIDISFLSLLFQRTYIYNRQSQTICIKTFYLKLKIFY